MLSLIYAALLCVALSSASPLALPAADNPSIQLRCSWPGWSEIEHMFIFGDSYTTTGFSTTGTQPSPSNPLGNPAYPGYTSSNGPNWVDILTTTYNKSLIETVNLAYGGATIDSSLVAPYETTVLSLKQQIEQEYLPTYAQPNSTFPWTPSNTLFGVWIGINDVGNSYYNQNITLNSLIFDVYRHLVDELYHTGARNFLFINVPPTNKSPSITTYGEWAETTLAADIADFNSRITAMASNLTKKYKDTTAFIFDSNSLFDQILANPCTHAQTCPIKNTTAYCDAYENGTVDVNSFDSSCGVPVDEYFWLNGLHPTYRMHNATAQEVAAQLGASSTC